MLNERQEGLITELKEKFESMNVGSSVKGNVLPIADLLKKNEDDKQALVELEEFNKRASMEAVEVFMDQYRLIKPDLEALGFEVSVEERGNYRLSVKVSRGGVHVFEIIFYIETVTVNNSAGNIKKFHKAKCYIYLKRGRKESSTDSYYHDTLLELFSNPTVVNRLSYYL